jgi:hypothetical protein
MKSYSMTKLLVARTGIIYVSNKYGRKWIEIRVAGKLVRVVTLANPEQEWKLDNFIFRHAQN